MRKIVIKITAIVLSSLLIIGFTFPVVTLSEEKVYTIYGRGHDHGWGLCMAGVKGMANARYTYTDILSKYYQGTSLGAVDENQLVRVGLHRTATGPVTVTSSSQYNACDSSDVVLATIPAGVSATVAYSAGIYTLTFNGKSLTTDSYLTFSSLSPLKVTQAGKYCYCNGKIEVRYSTNSLKLWAINVLSLNQYLYGLGEEPETWPMEGLKVLSVAARTYALEKKYNPNSRHKKDKFDVCSTADCQYYVGVRNAPNLKSAVDSTAGQVLTHPEARLYTGAPGRLIVAAYHACCGGHTEKLSCLNGVPCGFCGWHSKHTWQLTFTSSTLQAKLNTDFRTQVLGDLLGFEILSYEAASPRVKTIRILGTGGYKDVGGKTFYPVIGGWSAWFSFENSYYYTARL
ncbi:MAG: SpoIID/LytB domain-containing protein, partial [Candidatus Subteraquimicrobiales bacterium]|nr:SpoIID/LytB domain-containing protein [Candidatus Subteraquimicrobiales bacterium]